MRSKAYLFIASLHVIIIAWFYSYDFKVDQKLKDFHLGWLQHRCSFLTLISFQSNAIYFFISAFRERTNLISKLYLFLVKIFLWVAIMYWLMYIMDPDLVLRDKTPIHPIISYTLHGFNLLLIMTPLFITSNKVTTSSFWSDLFEGVFQMVTYNLILQCYKIRFGFQVYPFLDKLDGLALVKFNLFVIAWSVFFGFLLRKIFF